MQVPFRNYDTFLFGEAVEMRREMVGGSRGKGDRKMVESRDLTNEKWDAGANTSRKSYIGIRRRRKKGTVA